MSYHWILFDRFPPPLPSGSNRTLFNKQLWRENH
jgi:hypothetical protein